MKVLITRDKLDDLAVAVAEKAGLTTPLTLAQMQTAVENLSPGGGTLITKNINANGTYTARDDSADGYSSVTVNVPTPTPTLQTKTKTYTPTESAQTESVSADAGYDGIDTVDVTVNAISSTYVGSQVARNDSTDLTASGATVTAPAGYYANSASKSVASGTAGTPTATKGTVSNHSVSVTPSVTNTTGYIDGGTKTGTAVSVSASELVSGTYNVDSSGTKDVTNYASASVPAGTAGTPTATKGAVSNHAVTVTPSVTNQAGYIAGGTKTGTGVQVTAAELVSGSETKSANGTYDVTNLAEIVVDVQGGSVNIDTKTLTNSSASNTSISFTGLSGEPKAFFLRCTNQLTRSSNSSYYYVTDMRWNGSSGNHNGNYWRMSNGTFYNDTSHYSHTYSNGTLTISSSGSRSSAGGSFYNGGYELVYVY